MIKRLIATCFTVIIIILSLAAPILALDTSILYPASGTRIYKPSPESLDWTYPDRIEAADESYSYPQFSIFDTGNITCWLIASDFSVNIPVTANVDGIYVEIGHHCSQGEGRDYRVQLTTDSGATSIGDNKADTITAWPGTWDFASYGESSDKWGVSLTPNEINSSGFGVVLSAKSYAENTFIKVDYIRIIIYYTNTPTLSGSAADSITTTEATLHGEITDTGGDSATSRGFEWDTDSGAPYTNDWHEDGAFGIASFSQGITGLPSDSTIYWRAYAENPAGTGYSSERNFTTEAEDPPVISITLVILSLIAATGAGIAFLRGELLLSGMGVLLMLLCILLVGVL